MSHLLKTIFKYFVELSGNPFASSLLKSMTSSRISRPLIQPFSTIYRINENDMEHPIHHYNTLQEFFTRRLKPNVRPINQSPNTIVSPVDGILSDRGKISSTQSFYIKNRLYTVKEVLGDERKAADYVDGYFFILYLSPSHYHRIHYPINGEVAFRYALGEKSYPVNHLGTLFGDKPFSTNYRLISELSTCFGKVAFVKIGALNINSIHLLHSSTNFKKGEELGYFSFGSTVMLFIEKNPRFKPTITMNSEVHMGQPIGEWI